jgi:hypothetical protein
MPKIRLNTKKLDAKRIELGWNKSVLAKRIGVKLSTLYRASQPAGSPHHDDPGGKFITGLLNAIPGSKFEDFFFFEK